MSPTDAEAPFSQIVLREWTDSNGHLNVAYYALVFDRGTDALLDALGIGGDYNRTTGHSTFALECHTRYLAEVHEGEDVVILSRLIGVDHKRVHYLHEMRVAGSDSAVATLEQISLHVSLASRRSVVWPDTVLARLTARAERDRTLPPLPLCGVIGVRGTPAS